MEDDKKDSNYDEAYNLEMERLLREEGQKAAREDFQKLKRLKKMNERSLRNAEKEAAKEASGGEESSLWFAIMLVIVFIAFAYLITSGL